MEEIRNYDSPLVHRVANEHFNEGHDLVQLPELAVHLGYLRRQSDDLSRGGTTFAQRSKLRATPGRTVVNIVSSIDSLSKTIRQQRTCSPTQSTHAMSDATSKLTTRWKNIDDMAGRLPQTQGATAMQLLEGLKKTCFLDERHHRKRVSFREVHLIHHLLGHDERVGRCGQASAKRRTQKRRNHERFCRALQVRKMDFCRYRIRKHKTENPKGNRDRKAADH